MNFYVADIETISDIDLKNRGTVNYFASPNTSITMLCCKKVNEEKIHYIVDKDYSDHGCSSVSFFRNMFKDIESGNGVVIAHNQSFEYRGFKTKLPGLLSQYGIDFNPDTLCPTNFRCTMVLSCIFRGPKSLAAAVKCFSVGELKDAIGSKVMKATCMLNTIPDSLNLEKEYVVIRSEDIFAKYVSFKNGHIKWSKKIADVMLEYCKKDVEVTSLLYKELTKKSRIDSLGGMKKYIVNEVLRSQVLNDKGIRVDMSAVTGLKKEITKRKAKTLSIVSEYFPEVKNLNSNMQVLNAIRSRGVEVESLSKDALSDAYIKYENSKDKKIQDAIKGLKILREADKKAFAKLDKINALVSSDGRLRDYLLFNGAQATGRWSSSGVQLQNLPSRDALSSYDEAVRCLTENDYDKLSNGQLTSLIRLLFMSEKGESLFCPDLAQIELRMRYLIVGSFDKIKMLHTGEDLYADVAHSVLGFSKEQSFKKNGKSPIGRDVGKKTELMLQYGGSADGFKRNILRDGMDPDSLPLEVEEIVKSWRKHNQETKRAWDKCSLHIKKSHMRGEDLEVTLRSGRKINYGKIKHFKEKTPWSKGRKVDVYKVFHPEKSVYTTIYGAMLFQNIIQAEARDVMLVKLYHMSSQGFDTLFTVHDEAIYSVSKDRQKEIRKTWEEAGKEDIQKIWPGLIVDSDGDFRERFYK